MSIFQRSLLGVLTLSLPLSCSDELLPRQDQPVDTSSSMPDTPSDSGTDPAPGPQDPDVTHVDQGGVWHSKINASNKTKWVYLDLDARVFPAADAGDIGPWDLAFQRVRVRVNGGSSGPGSVSGLMVAGKDAFDTMLTVPNGSFIQDQAPEQKDPEDIFDQEGKVFAFWYDYASQGHVVTPKAQAYAIKTDQGAVFKVQILDYYNEAKTSGHYTVRWAKLTP